MGASPRKSKSFARPDNRLSRRRFLALTGAAAAVGPLLAARPARAAKVTMKVAHVLTEADIIHRATAKFKEIAEKKAGGELEVQIYPTSALGSLRVTWESMQLGNLEGGNWDTVTPAMMVPAVRRHRAALHLPRPGPRPQGLRRAHRSGSGEAAPGQGQGADRRRLRHHLPQDLHQDQGHQQPGRHEGAEDPGPRGPELRPLHAVPGGQSHPGAVGRAVHGAPDGRGGGLREQVRGGLQRQAPRADEVRRLHGPHLLPQPVPVQRALVRQALQERPAGHRRGAARSPWPGSAPRPRPARRPSSRS